MEGSVEMSKPLESDAEMVSLLVDGQLTGEAFSSAMVQLTGSDHARQTWDHYHLVGEVMRSGHFHAKAHDAAFVQRLRRNLAIDDTKVIAVNASPISAGVEIDANVPAANDSWWRRVAGLASIAVVGVLSWQAYLLIGSSAPAQLAKSSPALRAPPQPDLVLQASVDGSAAMIRDPRLDALLQAHRQFGGTSALQMPSGFLRNATFEEGKR